MGDRRLNAANPRFIVRARHFSVAQATFNGGLGGLGQQPGIDVYPKNGATPLHLFH
jgi:hypothetical protein